MREQDPGKFLQKGRDSFRNRKKGRIEDKDADARWLGLFTKLKEAGFSQKIAAYAATATVFGEAVALLLYP